MTAEDLREIRSPSGERGRVVGPEDAFVQIGDSREMVIDWRPHMARQEVRLLRGVCDHRRCGSCGPAYPNDAVALDLTTSAAIFWTVRKCSISRSSKATLTPNSCSRPRRRSTKD